MKRSDLEKANRLHQQLAEIESQIAAVEAEREIDGGSYLGVTLAGRYQDKAFVDACRDKVLSELQRCARQIEADLSDIGVGILEIDMGYDIPSSHSSSPRRASDTGDVSFEPVDPPAPLLPPRHTIAEAAIHHHAKMMCFYCAELVTLGFGCNEALDIIKADPVPW